MKLLKRFFLILFLLFAFAIGTVVVIATQYEDKVIDYVKVELGGKLSREVDFGNMEYSLFSNFPNVSVNLNNVQAHSFEKGDKPFFRLQRIYLVFDLLSLMDGEFLINQVLLEEGEVNIIYNKQGEPNFNLFKESKDSSSTTSFSIENIGMQNVNVGYFNWKENQEYAIRFNEAEITPESLQDSIIAKMSLTGDIQPVNVDGFKTVKPIPVEGDFTISVIGDDLKFSYSGDFNGQGATFKGLMQSDDSKELWDFDFVFENRSAQSLIRLLPNDFLNKDIRALTGQVSARVVIKGDKKAKKLPPLEISYSVKNAEFKSGNYTFKSVNASGKYFQPNLNSTKGANVKANSFKAIYDNITITGSGNISQFKRPLIDAKIKSDFNLKELHRTLLSDDFQMLEGDASFDMHLKGRLIEVFANKNLRSLNKFKSDGVLNVTNVVAQPKDFDYPINISTGKLRFAGKNINLDAFEGNIVSSNFKMSGRITNYLKTILASDPLTFESDLEMDKLVLEDLVGQGADSTNNSTEPYSFNLPKSILLRTDLKLGEFSFRKFKGKNVSGEVLLKNQTLAFNDLQLETCDGKANLNGSINAKYENKVVFKCVSNLKDIDAKESFNQFENFGQDVLKEKHVKGRISIVTNLIAESDKGLNLDENKIYTETQLKIDNGELVGFEPLIELQDYLNKEFKLSFNLAHLKFSTIKNDIEINSGTIHIPEMAIRSSDINLDLEGTHSFDQEIDYLLKIKHSEIFKAKQQNKIDAEFGVIENNDKTATLPLRMRGNIDDPKFSYDTKTKVQGVKIALKNEGKEIKQVLKDEFKNIFKPKEKKDPKEDKEEEDLNKERTGTTTELIWDEDAEDEDNEDEED